jgi:hypothetical protein
MVKRAQDQIYMLIVKRAQDLIYISIVKRAHDPIYISIPKRAQDPIYISGDPQIGIYLISHKHVFVNLLQRWEWVTRLLLVVTFLQTCSRDEGGSHGYFRSWRCCQLAREMKMGHTVIFGRDVFVNLLQRWGWVTRLFLVVTFFVNLLQSCGWVTRLFFGRDVVANLPQRWGWVTRLVL